VKIGQLVSNGQLSSCLSKVSECLKDLSLLSLERDVVVVVVGLKPKGLATPIVRI